MTAVSPLGVVGAGTMGRGIAQLGATGGMATWLYDPVEAALADAVAAIERDLHRAVERGRCDAAEAEQALERLHPVDDLAALDRCELVIEAVPEDVEIKAAVFARLPNSAVLATNTSSLSVTALAARAPRPELVVGMHFFNPPTRMRLVEIVAGARTDPSALARARAVAIAMGRTPIAARDSVGFLVNRCGRPFYAEALRLVDEGVADAATVDRICRIGGRFRMGPFELMDLVGIDTGLAVAESFTAQSYGEPRWKPSPTQRRLVDAGRLGRKTGCGWYDYGGAARPEDPPVPNGHAGDGRTLVVIGESSEATALRARARCHGFDVVDVAHADGQTPCAVMAFSGAPEHELGADLPAVFDCSRHALAAIGDPRAMGFHILPPVATATLIELTAGPAVPVEARHAVESTTRALGLHAEWVDDAPAMVLGRIVSQLVNEACFAVGEGVGAAEDVDIGLQLGLNHPLGPFEWGQRIGLDAVLARIDGLWADRHEDRYRAAPLLRRAASWRTDITQLTASRPLQTVV